MKKKIFFLGMTVLILSLGLAFVGCKTDDDSGGSGGNDGSLNGTWVKGSDKITVSGNTYEWDTGTISYKGSISYSGGKATATTTHYKTGSSDWQSVQGSQYTVNYNYSLSGNTLTISGMPDNFANMNGAYTKQ